MIAGCPLKSGFSTSASRDAANETRSVLQKRHLIAAALIVSPQTGQTLVSSLTARPPIAAAAQPGHDVLAADVATLINSPACFWWTVCRIRMSGTDTACP